MKERIPADDYRLLDSGFGRKLEQFGSVVLDRPCAQAVWRPCRPETWKKAHARFSRESGGMHWDGRNCLPASWIVSVAGVRMKLAVTDFGHVGLFPETRPLWHWIRANIERAVQRRPVHFLNLFAYSGGATLAAAQGGARCCHLDASKGMVEWARENAALNGLQDASIRWIVDDVIKFLRREVRRGRRYDAVLLDPPSFGRGRKGELYKIEEKLLVTLDLVFELLSDQPLFVVLTSHTPGFSPIVLQNLLRQYRTDGELSGGEMVLSGAPGVFRLPSGNWARWCAARG